MGLVEVAFSLVEVNNCSRLDGGAAAEEGISSSASLPRLRPPLADGRPRFAADMLARNGGELGGVRKG